MTRSKPAPEPVELTYPLRAACRLTGLSPELLRAWERRYGVVRPARTPGGTRRYSARDLERLRLVKAAVDAGHRIGQVAHLDTETLRARVAPRARRLGTAFEEVLEALERLDGAEAQRLLSLQLAAHGPVRFAQEFACPLAREIGERWAHGSLAIGSEHLGTAVLRSLLGAALQPTSVSLLGPRLVFGTLPGERHELGLLSAALTAMGAGARPLYLGTDLPLAELLSAVERSDASVLCVSVVMLDPAPAGRALAELRSALPGAVRLWIGGGAAARVARPDRVELIETLADLERRVASLDLEPAEGE
jgi:DNA-binding transcriptional MerR regulator